MMSKSKVIDIKLIPPPNDSIRSPEPPKKFWRLSSRGSWFFGPRPPRPWEICYFFLEWSLKANEGTKMCRNIDLVGLETRIKPLSHQGNEIVQP